MAEELKYRISFTKGSLAGQLFPLGAESVIVGRSHTCGIRVMEPDVSGRHVMLSAGPKGVGMEVISSRRTMLDGKALKTGDKVPVKAGQSVSMGGAVAFVIECYRNDGDRTEAPGDWTDGMTRFGAEAAGGDADATRRPGAVRAGDETSMTTPAAGGSPAPDDDDTGTHIPPPPPSRPKPPPVRYGPPPSVPATPTGTIGTLAVPLGPPPPSGGETLGTEALQPPADATQVIQTRAATPQEMAYMRELHNKKRRKKLGMRIALSGLLVVFAAVVYAFLDKGDHVLYADSRRKEWHMLDSALQPLPAGGKPEGALAPYFSYPPPPWGNGEGMRSDTNEALGVEETIFTVRTRVGRNPDFPLQLRLVVYANPASLQQSQEEAFADWERTGGQGIEKQGRLANDFFGADPGIPCLRYAYTRKATPGEEAEGVLDWAGVLSFFRLRDTCFVYFREVPGNEGLLSEAMLLRTGIFLGIGADMVQERWAGMPPERQYHGDLPMLRNSVRGLMDKNMDNAWEEIEDKLSTILIRTYPRRTQDPDTGRLHEEALEWMRILRARQAETWKKRCLVRYRASRDKDADTARMDEEIRSLFRSPDDRRHVTAQKDRWWTP